LLEILPTFRFPNQITALSSGVSSISDNREGGMCAYRMSKCALNMGMREVWCAIRQYSMDRSFRTHRMRDKNLPQEVVAVAHDVFRLYAFSCKWFFH
jgi:hypothetical protein